jgi:hypothetical protein
MGLWVWGEVPPRITTSEDEVGLGPGSESSGSFALTGRRRRIWFGRVTASVKRSTGVEPQVRIAMATWSVLPVDGQIAQGLRWRNSWQQACGTSSIGAVDLDSSQALGEDALRLASDGHIAPRQNHHFKHFYITIQSLGTYGLLACKNGHQNLYH